MSPHPRRTSLAFAPLIFAPLVFAPVLFTLFGSRALAQDVYPWEIRQIEALTKRSAINTSMTAPDCGPSATLEPGCAELTDDTCATLWSKKNQGRLKVSDGELELGRSLKSTTAATTLANLHALVDSFPRLPADLQAKAKPVLDGLRKTLAAEQDSKDWYRAVSKASNDWQEMLNDLGDERAEKKHPELKSIPAEKLMVEQRALYKAEDLKLAEEVLDAKYATDKNWQRVERVFAEAKKDLAGEIDALNLPPEQKQAMRKKIETIQLTLPYTDPNKTGVQGTCSTSDLNAFYLPRFHKFTVCAGMFNAVRSDTALYLVIAHEISHSVDAMTLAIDKAKAESPLEKKLVKIATPGPSKMSCGEWQNFVGTLKTAAAPAPVPGAAGLQSLYECLTGHPKLLPLDSETVESLAQQASEGEINYYATSQILSDYAKPTTTVHGASEPNQFYMNKARARASINDGVFLTAPGRSADGLDIFDIALRCEKIDVDGKPVTYAEAPVAKRSLAFNRAIARTAEVLTARNKNTYMYCGANCPDLVRIHFAANSGENFADWLGARAFNKHLSRLPDLRARREGAGAAVASLCDESVGQDDAHDLKAAEKAYSFEEHPDGRRRRLSVFNTKNAVTLKCEASPSEQGFGACEL